MKSLVVYYSFSGNTRKVAKTLCGFLATFGPVDETDLVPVDQPRSFFGRCQAAFWQRKARLQPGTFDCRAYDLVCIGTPVWAFGPAPAVNTFLAKASGLDAKKVILFNTHGGGPGINRCFAIMKKSLANTCCQVIGQLPVYQEDAHESKTVLNLCAPVAQWIGH